MALKVQFGIRFSRPHLFWGRLALCSYSDVPAVHACGAAGSSAEFESVIQSLKNNLQPDRLTRVLESTSDLHLSLRIFKWASHQRMFVHTVDTYACKISKLGAVGNCDEMDRLLKEMIRSDAPAMDKLLSDIVQFLCSRNRCDEALLVIQNACSGKVKLSVSSCNALLSGLVKEGRGLRPFIRAYMEIVKAGVLPNVETLNWLIEVLCAGGHLDLALIQFDRMSKKRCTPNSNTFKILITALCSNGRADESVKLFEKMLQLRYIPDSCFYIQVLPLFCKFNKPKEASKLHQMMKKDNLQLDLDLYSALIRCLCENQLLDDAVITFKEMVASGHAPMTSTCVDLIDCYCTFAQFHEAVSFLEENNVSETEPYNVLLRAFCKTGRLWDSVKYLEEFHNKGLLDSNSWNTVVTQFCNEGNIRGVSMLIARMTVLSFTVDESTYSSIVSCYCQLGLYKKALDMFRRVSVCNLLLTSESFSQLVEGLCYMKRIQEAAEVFKYHCNRGCSLTSESLDLLIQQSCMAGMVREAIKMRLLAVCAGTSCSFSTYNTIIQALLHLKKEKDVLLVLAQLLMDGCLLNNYAYNNLLCCCLTKETILEAAILFNTMVNYSFVPDQETFELLVHEIALFSSLNMVSRSLLLVLNIDGMMSHRISNIIIYGLIKEGFKIEASKFLDQMLEKGWVPDSMTHGVLVGTIGGEQAREVDQVFQTVDDDNVSNILLEGLE